MQSRRRGLTGGMLSGYGLLLLLTFLILFPVIWIIAQSFMQEAQIYRWPINFIPSPATFQNYANLFTYRPDRPDLPIARWLFNSAFVATSVTVLILTVASMAGYAFARFEFPGKTFFFYLFGASLLIPSQITFIPSFLIVRAFGWIDTYHALIWPPIAGFFGVFFLRQFFLTIPRDFEDAAIIDGCSRWGVFRHVILPLSTSAMVTLAIFTFLGAWNDFVWTLIVLNSNEMRTLTVGLTIFNGEYWSEQGIIMAGAVFTSLPIVIVFLFLQKRISESVLLAGIGGR
ncbi:MAG: carbohydrate ABC transporter permease [Caldilinea sp.]|uniref:carbohydrate ABC transporter permease n=1 Tax=Caldilinea sp. TaxID=2293560 RepID=UPI002CA2262F|nr:carbohydrate ABC transporter permease [Caldilinea sp.]HRA65684.1 carbohydrate ABC transporter permease [Caldilinea sp.]